MRCARSAIKDKDVKNRDVSQTISDDQGPQRMTMERIERVVEKPMHGKFLGT